MHARPPEKWEGKKEYQTSFRDQIRAAIDRALEQNPKDWEELIGLLHKVGYEYKPGAQFGPL